MPLIPGMSDLLMPGKPCVLKHEVPFFVFQIKMIWSFPLKLASYLMASISSQAVTAAVISQEVGLVTE